MREKSKHVQEARAQMKFIKGRPWRKMFVYVNSC